MANAGIVSENTKVQILYVKNDWKGKKKKKDNCPLILLPFTLT